MIYLVLTHKQKSKVKKLLKKHSPSKVKYDLCGGDREIVEYIDSLKSEQKIFDTKHLDNKSVLNENKEQSLVNLILKNKIELSIIISIVFLIYINGLHNEFVSDDKGLISSIDSGFGTLKYVFRDYTYASNSFRQYLTYKVFGFVPEWHRIINIIFHTLVTFFAYLAIQRMTANKRLSLLVGLLFAVHPVLTESVVWISGSYYSQYALFFLFSFVLYTYRPFKKKIYYLVSLFAYFIAITTSEKASVLVGVLFLYEQLYGSISKNLKYLIPYAVGSILMVFFTVGRFEKRVSNLKTVYNTQSEIGNPITQIPVAITEYLKLIFWPADLTLYHTELGMPVWEYYVRLVLTIIFFGLIVYYYRKVRGSYKKILLFWQTPTQDAVNSRDNKFVVFWLLFFVITLLPTLLPLGVGWVVAERYVYLGTLGILAVVSHYVLKLAKYELGRTIVYITLPIIIVGLSYRTILRNRDWKNEDTLWFATAKTSPSSHNNYNNLGDVYSRRGDYQKAIENFLKAIELKPDYADAYHNLANTYEKVGKVDLAKKNYIAAIEYKPILWQSHSQLALLYGKEGNYKQAVSHMQSALKIASDNYVLWYNFAMIYYSNGNIEDAQVAIRKAYGLNPNEPAILKLLKQIEAEGNLTSE